jgi:hypothetical protein
MKRLIALTFLLAGSLTVTHAQLIIFNASFDSVTTDAQGDLTPVNWTVPGGNGGEATNDAHDGPYAARIYNYSNLAKGELFYGTTNSPEYTGMTLLDVPVALHGYYKYVLGNNGGGSDSAEVFVNVTLYNQTNGHTDTVKTGHAFLTPSFSYSAFTVPIQASVEPEFCDTLRIRFVSSVNGICDSTSIDSTCCYLFVDQLSIEFASGVVQRLGDRSLALIYDASQHRLQLLNADNDGKWSIALVDATGRKIMDRRDVQETYTNLPDELSPGIYMYRVEKGAQRAGGKVAIYR